MVCFFFQAEDGIRDLVRSRGLGDVYKRQVVARVEIDVAHTVRRQSIREALVEVARQDAHRARQRLSLIHI